MCDNRLWAKRLSARMRAFVLVVAMAFMLGFAGWLLGGAEMALAAFAAVVGLYWMQPLMGPHWILRIQQGQPLSPESAPGLYQLVRELARRAGLEHTPRRYLLPGDVMNAFTVGSGQHALLGISRGLLRNLDREALAAV